MTVAAAHQPATNEEAAAAAKETLTRFVDSWNRADAHAYSENYWPDAELVDPLGAIKKGREAIAQAHAELWAGPFKGTVIAGTIRAVHRLDANVIVVDLDLKLKGAKLPPSVQVDAEGALNTHLKHVLQKREGVWRTVLAQNTFVQ